VRIEAFAPSATSPTASISCTIVPLNSSCTAAGPSATVPANSSLRVSVTVQPDSTVTATTDLLFSWKAAAS